MTTERGVPGLAAHLPPANDGGEAEPRTSPGSGVSEIEHVYATAPIGLALLDPDLRFVRINKRLAAINGLPVDAHIGRTIEDIVPDLLAPVTAIRDDFLDGVESTTRLLTGTTPAQPGIIRYWIEHWSAMRGEDGTLIGLQAAVEEISEQRRDEERRHMLSMELRHRLNNTLAVVQGIARATFRGAEGTARLLEEFEARIAALATVHKLLVAGDWQRAEVGAIVRSAVTAFHPEQASSDGPPVEIGADAAMGLGLALHELCTNATKYGALSVDTGSVDIRWTLEGKRVRLVWQERGGPAVVPRTKRGFGSRLLDRFLHGSGSDGRLEFAPDGVRCTILLDVEQPRAD